MLPYLFSAIPTPFLDNQIDYNSIIKLIDFQISNGVQAIVVAGSTGEGQNLTFTEWKEMSKFIIDNYKNKIHICLATGFNSTHLSIEYSQYAEKIGADSIMAVVPYYNKPQQDGIMNHFLSIANATNLPIIMYNVPGRTVTDMTNETIVKILLNNQKKNIVALKDATGNISRVCELKNLLDQNNLNFQILSGEDMLQIASNSAGGRGLISVGSNAFPSLFAKTQELCKNFNYQEALSLQNEITQITNLMFTESNPVPVKYFLYKMGIFSSDEIRQPLSLLSENSKKKIDLFLNK